MIIIVVILYVKIQRTNLSIYSPVKSIQSNLKHLSWVAQRVAAGDYKQHVSSLGRDASIRKIRNGTPIAQLRARLGFDQRHAEPAPYRDT